MINIYKPTIYAKNIYEINYDLLQQKNINYLLFDIDNTLADSKTKYPPKEVIILFNALKEKGFTILLITNALPSRAKRFAKILNVKSYYLSFKPLSRNYNKILNYLNVKPNKIAAIGDQLLTDIKGANKQQITSILIDTISSKESILTKLNRLKEKRIIKKYQLLKRGEYYE